MGNTQPKDESAMFRRIGATAPITSLEIYAKEKRNWATAQALANLRMLRMRWSAARFEHDQRSLWQAHVNIPKCRSAGEADAFAYRQTTPLRSATPAALPSP
ncbi:hypothetical protein MESS4_330202 [Mesorhizobium sp. STM 4661]|nr:hypothetical protein MESS4_330202 [Mesorhizobium sp. STM 4661]